MKTITKFKSWIMGMTIAAMVVLAPTAVLPQEAGEDAAYDADKVVEEIVVTGTRREGQSPTQTLSPVDVFSGAELANQATFDMTESLAKISPSINNQRFPIADGTAFIRPVTLRNLSPEQTLVPVHGTARHRTSSGSGRRQLCHQRQRRAVYRRSGSSRGQ